MATRKVLRKTMLNGEQYFLQDNWVTTIKQGNTVLGTISPQQSTNQDIVIPTPSQQVQPDWNESDSSAADYIKNKPTLWSAASKNTWNSAWNVPVLNSNGKLDDAVIPAVAITDVQEVATKAALLQWTDAQKWDVWVVTEENKCYMLGWTWDPTIEANWKLLKTPTDAVLSVNGKTWAVTLSEFLPDWTATTGYILVKTANWYWWAENVWKVASVNWKTGQVVLDADDIDDANTDNKFVTAAEKTAWNNKADDTDIWNWTATFTQAWVNIGQFSANQSGNWTLNFKGNKFLTQSEYNNLPADKATDWNSHFIYETITTD